MSKISSLPGTIIPSGTFEFPASKDGVTNKLTVQQVIDLANVNNSGVTGATVSAALDQLDTDKAPLASPALTGTPTAPTATAGTNTTQIASTAFVSTAIAASPNLPTFRNLLINGDFSVNQRAVSGTVTLAAGAYGHDRWKAGASGCTYTFATSANVTTLTITAGSLIQVIEGINLQSGTNTLSWVGTAQGKIGAGSYAASGVTGAATGGTNLNVEFNSGTLTAVQFEQGDTATEFEQLPYDVQLRRAVRYYYRIAGTQAAIAAGLAYNTAVGFYSFTFPEKMRAAPSCAFSSVAHFGILAGNTTPAATAITFTGPSTISVRIDVSSTFPTTGGGSVFRASSASAWLEFDAEL
jgi:hypothetical protein